MCGFAWVLIIFSKSVFKFIKVILIPQNYEKAGKMNASPSVQSPDLSGLGDSLDIPWDYQCDPINVYSCYKTFYCTRAWSSQWLDVRLFGLIELSFFSWNVYDNSSIALFQCFWVLALGGGGGGWGGVGWVGWGSESANRGRRWNKHPGGCPLRVYKCARSKRLPTMDFNQGSRALLLFQCAKNKPEAPSSQNHGEISDQWEREWRIG